MLFDQGTLFRRGITPRSWKVSFLSFFSLVLTLYIFPSNVCASDTAEPFNLVKLTRRAQRVFVGTVISRESGFDSLSLPVTVYQFRVEQAIKGVTGDVITIKQTGVAEVVLDKQTGVYTFPLAVIPIYQPGEKYLLFLNGDSVEGYTSPVGLGYGVFHINPAGEATNDINNAGLLQSLPEEAGMDVDDTAPRRGGIRVSDLVDQTQRTMRRSPEISSAHAETGQSAATVAAIEENKRVIRRPVEIGSNIGGLFSGHPIRYNVATAANPSGSVSAIPWDVETGTLGNASNAAAVAQVAASFGIWSGAPTATVPVAQSPGLLGVDIDSNCSGTAVPNPITSCYLNYYNRFPDGRSPIIFDNDGSIVNALFGSRCALGGLGGFQGTTNDGGITWTVESYVILNGAYLGGSCGANTLSSSGRIFTHELGHFLGLGHTVVNGELVISGIPYLTFGVPPCSSVEVMLSNSTPCSPPNTLQKDDIANISTLYPNASFANTGKISGRVFRPDGSTPFNCANIVLRNHSDPFNDAFGTITGVSKDFGAIPVTQTGSYSQQGLVLGHDYVIGAKQIPSFSSGSHDITQLCTTIPTMPGPAEFYNGQNESSDPAVDNPACFTPVTAQTNVTGINITLNSSTGSTASCNNTPIAALSGTAFSFGTVFQRQYSSPQTLTLTNTGGGTLTLNGVSAVTGNSVDFSVIPNCGTGLHSNQSCNIELKFRPLLAGPRSYTFSLSTDAPVNPGSVALSGTGGEFSFALTRPSRPTRSQAAGANLQMGTARSLEMQLVSTGVASGPARLSCNAPSGVQCRIEPDTLKLDSATTKFVVVVITDKTARVRRLVKRAIVTGNVEVRATVGDLSKAITIPVEQF
ncbi:MAG: hypothetical protein JWN45_1658 [Acidobacteriaceae bacterium]|nr:hypothetical protein [Acidobacteriaceae bacterium]